MSSDNSPAFAGKIEDIQYLDIGETSLHKNYNSKGPLDKSNELLIAQSKDKVCMSLNT